MERGAADPTILLDGRPVPFRRRDRPDIEAPDASMRTEGFLLLVEPTRPEHTLEIRNGDAVRTETLHFQAAAPADPELLPREETAPKRGLVSIVTIFLNGREFFDEARESIFRQSYTDWEWLLVDDGSSDGMTEIAQGLAAQFPERIRYLCHPGRQNRGMSASRNLGLRHARGEFLALLDVDDIYLPDKLAVHVDTLRRHPECAMVYGPLHFWYGWTGKPEDLEKEFVCPMGEEHDLVVAPPQKVLRVLDKLEGLPAPCSMLLRSDVAREVGGFETAFPGMYEDEAFFSKICCAYPIYLLSSIHERYRQHPNSYCAEAERRGEYYPGRRNRSRYRFLCWLQAYARGRNLTDVLQAVTGELDRFGAVVGPSAQAAG